MKIKLAFSILIPLTLLVGGCGSGMDVRAVRELAVLGDKANQIFPKIADDIYLSCLRSARYIPLRRVTSAEKGILDQRNEYQTETCDKTAKPATNSLITAHSVVIGYLGALGNLASDDITNINYELDTISTSLNTIAPTLNQDQVSAGTAITKLLYRISTEKYRRGQLKNVIVETDPFLQVYMDGLTKAVGSNYIDGYLKTENLSVKRYYSSYVATILNSEQSNSPEAILAVTGLDTQWQEAQENIQDKQEFAQSYLALLKRIALDHTLLKDKYAQGKAPSTQELNKMLDNYIKTLKPLVEKSDKLFDENYK